jgi:hypothetical protein
VDVVSLTFTLANNTNNSDILSQINQITLGIAQLLNQNNNTNFTGLADIIVTEVIGDSVSFDVLPANNQTFIYNVNSSLINSFIPGSDFNISDIFLVTNARRLE